MCDELMENPMRNINNRKHSFQAGKRRARRNTRGLTLIEILVVVTILGLIAGIVGVNVIGQLTGVQGDTARTQIKGFTDALDIYKMKTGRYPNTTEGLNALVSPPKGRRPMMENIPKDPWGNDYIFLSPGQHNAAKFDIYSKGPDGQSGTEDDISNWEN